MAEALALEKGGDWDGALEVYQRVLKEKPGDLGAMTGMATGLWLTGRYDDALAFQEAVVAANPQDIQTTLELAFNYLNHQGRPRDAVDLLEEASSLEYSGRILTYLGLARREAGDLSGAEESFREAIAAEPTYGLAYHELVRLLEQQGRTEEAAVVRAEASKNGVEVTNGSAEEG